MSIIATAVKHLIAAGVTGEALVAAIAEMEAARPVTTDPVADKRRAYDRERKRNNPKKGRKSSGGIPVESAESAGPLPPNDIYSNPPTLPLDVSDETSSPVSEIDDEQVPALQPEHVVEAWNDMAGRHSLPKAKLTPERRRKLLARLKQHTVDEWTEAIGAIERNPWMHGDNDRGWRADFDFLLQTKSFTKLIEGSYDRASQAH